MEIGLAVGGAFLSSALNVLFDMLAPHGNLLNMFQKNKNDVRLLKKLRMTLLGLQAVLSDAENKQTSNPSVSQWLNELRDTVDSAENIIEEVNYEVLRLKVEGQHQYLAETGSHQCVNQGRSMLRGNDCIQSASTKVLPHPSYVVEIINFRALNYVSSYGIYCLNHVYSRERILLRLNKIWELKSCEGLSTQIEK